MFKLVVNCLTSSKLYSARGIFEAVNKVFKELRNCENAKFKVFWSNGPFSFLKVNTLMYGDKFLT